MVFFLSFYVSGPSVHREQENATEKKTEARVEEHDLLAASSLISLADRIPCIRTPVLLELFLSVNKWN